MAAAHLRSVVSHRVSMCSRRVLNRAAAAVPEDVAWAVVDGGSSSVPDELPGCGGAAAGGGASGTYSTRGPHRGWRVIRHRAAVRWVLLTERRAYP